MNSLSISVGALRHALAMRPTEARVNITIVPQGDVAQDFNIHSMHWDDAVDTFDLVVNLPEGVSLTHNTPTPDYVRYAVIFAADVTPGAQMESGLNTEEFAQLAIDIGKIAAKRNNAARAAGEDFYPVAFVEQAAQRLNELPHSTFDELLVAGQVESDSIARRPRKVWSSGWNVSGYLPEVEPMNFPTWVEARDALVEALHEAMDVSMSDEEATLYDAAIADLNTAEEGIDWCWRVGNYVWWVQQIVLPKER